MLLRPETPLVPFTAALRVCGTIISTGLPERHERFVAVLKRLGYAWDERSGGAWTRTINATFNGTVDDRVVELGHALLTAGFLIEVPDTFVERIMEGNFAEECRRWVKCVLAGPYAGWLSLSWERSADLYTQARRIRGSRYVAPTVVVPADSYAEVLDFADRFHFQTSPKAQEVIDAAKARYATAVLVAPKPRRKPAVATPSAAPASLIDPELRDDDDA